MTLGTYAGNNDTHACVQHKSFNVLIQSLWLTCTHSVLVSPVETRTATVKALLHSIKYVKLSMRSCMYGVQLWPTSPFNVVILAAVNESILMPAASRPFRVCALSYFALI